MPVPTILVQRTNRSPRLRLRVGRVLFLALIILLLVGWRHRPIVPQLVARIPADGLLWSRQEGFLTTADDPASASMPTKVTCWRWSGPEAWSVTLPKADLTGWSKAGAWNGREFSLSPDGDTLACACADGQRVRVITWRDGLRVGEYALRLSAQPAMFRVLALDDGQALFWQAKTLNSPVLLINGNQCLVMAHRSTLPITTAYERSFTPDGHWLVGYAQTGRKTYTLESANLEMVGSRPILFPYFKLKHIQHPYLFSGAIVDSTGASFRKRADMTAPDNWSIAPDAGLFPDCAVQRKGAMLRITRPVEDQHWYLSNVPPAWGIGVSRDGRFAVTYPTAPSHVPPLLTGLLHARALAEPTSLLCAARVFNLYTTPGRLVASMKLSGVQTSIRQAFLSPDGEHMLLNIADTDSGKNEYRLYRLPDGVRQAIEHMK